MNITIDGLVYDLNSFTEEAKAQLASVQASDIKLNELRRDTAITMTARNSYMQALKKELERLSPITQDIPAAAEQSKSRAKSSPADA